jgi:quinolinate synthase
VVWDPHRDEGGLDPERVRAAKVLLWRGHCSVHARFLPEHVDLATEHPDKTIAFLDRTVCFCSTMNRIDLPHLTWALEELAAGRVPNRVTVDEATRAEALVALERMLALPG